MYLIQFPSDEDHEKAIEAWMDITTPRSGFTENRVAVTDEHIRALKRAKVKFHYLSKPRSNVKTPARRKS